MKRIVVVLAALVLVACGSKSHSANDAKNASQDNSIERLQMSVDFLRERLDGVTGNLSAVLTPDEKGFSYLSDGAVSATISLKGLEQKGSAVLARLQIGNLTSALLKKCSLVIQVRKTKDGLFEPGTFQAIDGNLMPGKYNDTTVMIPDTKTSDVSAIKTSSITCESVWLNV